jgi:predicted RNA-binding protein associated with RNAse of E/G family
MPAVTGQSITVVKLNLAGQETWRYTGHVLQRQDGQVTLEALFNREDIPFHGILLGKGDRFVETYYADHWYNIFEIHDRADDRLKGWYCNVTRPAELSPDEVCYVDLALDLLVYPDGSYLILDEDEFSALGVDDFTRIKARQALDELVTLVQNNQLPHQAG